MTNIEEVKQQVTFDNMLSDIKTTKEMQIQKDLAFQLINILRESNLSVLECEDILNLTLKIIKHSCKISS